MDEHGPSALPGDKNEPHCGAWGANAWRELTKAMQAVRPVPTRLGPHQASPTPAAASEGTFDPEVGSGGSGPASVEQELGYVLGPKRPPPPTRMPVSPDCTSPWPSEDYAPEDE